MKNSIKLFYGAVIHLVKSVNIIKLPLNPCISYPNFISLLASINWCFISPSKSTSEALNLVKVQCQQSWSKPLENLTKTDTTSEKLNHNLLILLSTKQFYCLTSLSQVFLWSASEDTSIMTKLKIQLCKLSYTQCNKLPPAFCQCLVLMLPELFNTFTLCCQSRRQRLAKRGESGNFTVTMSQLTSCLLPSSM